MSKQCPMGSNRIQFDPYDPAFSETGVPFDVLRRIREEQPVLRLDDEALYVSRYDDVLATLNDLATFRTDMAAITGIGTGVESVPEDQHFLSEIEEPRHKEVRKLFTSVVAPQRLRAMEPDLQNYCHRLIDALMTQEVADLHEGYAMAIPAFAMSRLMGLPDSVVAQFMAWSWDGTLMQRPASPSAPAAGPDSFVYFARVLAEQRAMATPGNDVFAMMIDARIDGAPLTDMEIVTQLHFMIMAGVHTTRSLLVHLVNRLVQDDAQWDELKADRAKVGPFIEESLRRDSPVQRTTRRCTRDAAIGDIPVAAGTVVEVGIGSANHDDRVFDDPEAFRIGRPNARRHVAFGTGGHVCPGAGLARLEGKLIVSTLLDRVDRLERIPGAFYPPLPGSLGHQPILARLIAS